MPRTSLSSANRAQASGPVARICEMVSIAFPSGTVYYTSNDVSIAWNGITWQAGCQLVQVGTAVESTDGAGRQLTLQFQAEPALLAKVMQDDYQLRDVEIYLAFLDSSGQLVADPYPLAVSLYASTSEVELNAGTATISLQLETDDVFMSRDSAVLVTDASQQARYPGDTGMQYVTAVADLTVKWGGRAQKVGSPSTSFAIADDVERLRQE